MRHPLHRNFCKCSQERKQPDPTCSQNVKAISFLFGIKWQNAPMRLSNRLLFQCVRCTVEQGIETLCAKTNTYQRHEKQSRQKVFDAYIMMKEKWRTAFEFENTHTKRNEPKYHHRPKGNRTPIYNGNGATGDVDST